MSWSSGRVGYGLRAIGCLVIATGSALVSEGAVVPMKILLKSPRAGVRWNSYRARVPFIPPAVNFVLVRIDRCMSYLTLQRRCLYRFPNGGQVTRLETMNAICSHIEGFPLNT